MTALDGGKPDRPPIAFDARPGVLDGVCRHYGAKDRNDLYRAAGIDGFSVWDWCSVMGRHTGPLKADPEGASLDFWGNCAQRRHGLVARDTVPDLDRHEWPRVEDFDFSHIHARALEIKAADMSVAAGHLGLGYQMHAMLRGNEKSLMDVHDEAWMDRYLGHLGGFTLAYLDALLSAGRGEVDVVRADDDLGTMDRLIISPKTWRRFYKPLWKAAFEVVHRHGARVWFHSCGYIWPLLEDLVEIGVDCWNPFPSYVKDNDHSRLKEFRRNSSGGVRLALDGGVSHLTLVHGRLQEVIDETRRVLDTFAPDGGLLIAPSQLFTEDMPAGNILAFLDTCLNP